MKHYYDRQLVEDKKILVRLIRVKTALTAIDEKDGDLLVDAEKRDLSAMLEMTEALIRRRSHTFTARQPEL